MHSQEKDQLEYPHFQDHKQRQAASAFQREAVECPRRYWFAGGYSREISYEWRGSFTINKNSEGSALQLL